MLRKSFGKAQQAALAEWTGRGEVLLQSGQGRGEAAVQGSCWQGGLDERHFKGNDDRLGRG